MAEYLGFKVQRLKDDQCKLLMSNVQANNILLNIEFTDNLTNIEVWLRDAVEEAIDQRFNRRMNPEKK